MIPVSVVVITLNEERRIGDCLKALGDFSEIFVVDSGSIDATTSIAASCGARVVNFSWNGQYPKKKEWCLEKLPFSHPWVFFIDADEVATPEMVSEIAKLDFSCVGYFVSARIVWGDRVLRHGARHRKISLIDRRKFMYPRINDLGLQGMGELEGHYQPCLRPAYAGNRIGMISAPMMHRVAWSRQAWMDKHDRYATWEAGMNIRKAWPRDPVKWRQILKVTFRAMPCRDILVFVHGYFACGGFMDGRAGLDYALARAAYYRMIAKKTSSGSNLSCQKAV